MSIMLQKYPTCNLTIKVPKKNKENKSPNADSKLAPRNVILTMMIYLTKYLIHIYE